MRMPWLALLFLALAAGSGSIARAAGRPITIADLLAVKSVSDPQISPDSTRVAYVVSVRDPETGKSNSDLYLVPVAGGEPRQLTTAPGSDSHPRWSPDGQTIAFLSDRGGSAQVWLLPVGGGEARPLTKLPIDVAGPIWSPRGDQIIVAAEVYPGTTPEQTAERDKERAESKSKARSYDALMVRHWDRWDDGKRSHLFAVDAASGAARDLMPGWTANVPPLPFGGSTDYAVAPAGDEVAFTSEPLADHAWSTNTDIWTVPLAGGEPVNRTASNPGADAQPAYSPDGTRLAYVRQRRAGFEADQWVLTILDRADGASRPITEELDRPVTSLCWTADSRRILAVLDDEGTEPIAAIDPRGADQPLMRPVTVDDYIKRIVTGGTNASPQLAPDGGTLVFARHDATHPAEIHRASADGGGMVALTRHNAPLLEDLDLAPAESFSFTGAEGDTVQGWLVRPPGFDPSKKYPVLLLIHGGPQGAWHDEWHARWNYPLFAAPGYALVAINPRGSTGFGQTFTDQISRDWGGRVYEDLMKGLDHALGAYPFLDAERLGALGGSYGGYMVNWICGHSDRFKALVSHAGVFDVASMYGTTEELWFPEWEFAGLPWDQPELYRELSPSTYAERFATPTLVIHGALDFRVPDGQGLGMFTSLKRRGVPARYVWFPDEGHWILKAANREVWWREVHAWLATYLLDATP